MDRKYRLRIWLQTTILSLAACPDFVIVIRFRSVELCFLKSNNFILMESNILQQLIRLYKISKCQSIWFSVSKLMVTIFKSNFCNSQLFAKNINRKNTQFAMWVITKILFLEHLWLVDHIYFDSENKNSLFIILILFILIIYL